MTFANFFSDPQNYAILAIPFFMWLSAQILKFIIYSLKHGLNWKYLFEYGHMPSSHTACMTGLVISAGYYSGIDSPVFAVAFTIGLITIYDAVKLRAYIGSYGKVINQITKKYEKENYPKLKERVGHTVQEVISGMAWGILGSVFFISLFNTFCSC